MNMTPHRQSPALRQALLRVRPAYFSWRLEEQERYRVAMPKDDEFRINQYLFHKLFQITVHTAEQLRMEWDSLGPEQLLILNETRLPVQGVGDDLFFLNDALPDGKTILDYDTLHEYDLEDHEFQERARKKEWPDHVIRPYRGSLYHRWARLYIDDRFIYATLSCAGAYIYGKLESHGFDYLHERIPHRYVPGRHHGKKEERGFRWDMRVDAGGQEAWLEELRSRFVRYIMQRYDELLDIWDRKALGRACAIDRSTAYDPSISFVFSDPAALKAVRFRHFMGDFRKIEQSRTWLDTDIEAELLRLEQHLDTELTDIQTNLDPRVRTLRQRRTITVHPDAAKDFFDL